MNAHCFCRWQSTYQCKPIINRSFPALLLQGCSTSLSGKVCVVICFAHKCRFSQTTDNCICISLAHRYMLTMNHKYVTENKAAMQRHGLREISMQVYLACTVCMCSFPLTVEIQCNTLVSTWNLGYCYSTHSTWILLLYALQIFLLYIHTYESLIIIWIRD